MNKCYILVGMSGSGKSTWVDNHYQLEAACVSADNYFSQETGEYKFDASKLGEAHNDCLRDFIDVTQNKFSVVFVDNTNLSKEEIFPYLKIAQAYGYEVTFVLFWPIYDADQTIQFCASRNVHSVPTETLERQYDKFYNSHFQQFISEQLKKNVRYISIEFGE